MAYGSYASASYADSVLGPFLPRGPDNPLLLEQDSLFLRVRDQAGPRDTRSATYGQHCSFQVVFRTLVLRFSVPEGVREPVNYSLIFQSGDDQTDEQTVCCLQRAGRAGCGRQLGVSASFETELGSIFDF